MKTLVLGDVHNRRDKFWSVLVQSGAVDADTGKKNSDVRVVQLGDLVSLGYDEREAEFYEWACQYIDEKLIGNHELPAFWFNDRHTHFGWDANTYHGWNVGRDQEAERLVRARFMRGEYKAATSVGPWLVTHAGVMPTFQRKYNLFNTPADEVSEWLNERFKRAMVERDAPELLEGPSSMFWVRIGELQNGYGTSEKHLKLIVGHTPVSKYFGEVVPGFLWNLDTPPVHHHIHGGVSGLLFNEDYEIVRYIYVE